MKNKGFTLLEIMLALAILGMMMGLITSSYYATARARERAEARMDLYQMGRSALSLIHISEPTRPY